MGRPGNRRPGGSVGDQLTAERVRDLIAELVAYGCGSWRDVKFGMGLREYAAMWRHWSDHPPLQIMVAAYLGIKPKSTPAPDQDAAFGEVLAMFGIAPGSTGGVIR